MCLCSRGFCGWEIWSHLLGYSWLRSRHALRPRSVEGFGGKGLLCVHPCAVGSLSSLLAVDWRPELLATWAPREGARWSSQCGTWARPEGAIPEEPQAQARAIPPCTTYPTSAPSCWSLRAVPGPQDRGQWTGVKTRR